MTGHPGEWDLIDGLWWLMAWLLIGAVLSLIVAPFLVKKS